jgi:hypothetical protein
MAFKNQLTVEVERNGKIFVFLMPSEATYGEAYDAAFEVLQTVLEKAKAAADFVKPKAGE